MKRKELSLTEDMFEKLKKEKELTGETVNSIIRSFINEGLKKRKKERNK